MRGTHLNPVDPRTTQTPSFLQGFSSRQYWKAFSQCFPTINNKNTFTFPLNKNGISLKFDRSHYRDSPVRIHTYNRWFHRYIWRRFHRHFLSNRQYSPHTRYLWILVRIYIYNKRRMHGWLLGRLLAKDSTVYKCTSLVRLKWHSKHCTRSPVRHPTGDHSLNDAALFC